MERTLLQRIHNPQNYVCGCDIDCWCRRTRVGRLVKWWFPARRFGIGHKNSVFDGMSSDIRTWKREQEAKGLYPMVVQPAYQRIVRLPASRWAFSVWGAAVAHEVTGYKRPRRR